MDFVFVKKSKLYRLMLYYLVWGLIVFHAMLFMLNFALIRRDSNVGLVIFNAVFLGVMGYVLFRHILPKYKYKVTKADYELFRISEDTLFVKYKDESKLYSFDNVVAFCAVAIFVPFTLSEIVEGSVVDTSNVTAVEVVIIVDSSEWLKFIWKPPGLTSRKLSEV